MVRSNHPGPAPLPRDSDPPEPRPAWSPQGPPCRWQLSLSWSPTKMLCCPPLPSSPFPPPAGRSPPNPLRTLSPQAHTALASSPASSRLTRAESSPSHSPGSRWPLRLSAHLGSRGHARCPPTSQLLYIPCFHVHSPLDLTPVTCMFQALAPDPGPHAQGSSFSLLLFFGVAVLKRGVHTPAPQSLSPKSPLLTL